MRRQWVYWLTRGLPSSRNKPGSNGESVPMSGPYPCQWRGVGLWPRPKTWSRTNAWHDDFNHRAGRPCIWLNSSWNWHCVEEIIDALVHEQLHCCFLTIGEPDGHILIHANRYVPTVVRLCGRAPDGMSLHRSLGIRVTKRRPTSRW